MGVWEQFGILNQILHSKAWIMTFLKIYLISNDFN